MEKLLECFDHPTPLTSCEHIARVLLTWVNNHYNDFEVNARLYEFLEIFDDRLQNHEEEVRSPQRRLFAHSCLLQHIRSWRRLINLSCFTRASIRTITVTRSTRDDLLNFQTIGGSDTLANIGIFVSKVEKNSKVYEAGLKRGDQVCQLFPRRSDSIRSTVLSKESTVRMNCSCWHLKDEWIVLRWILYVRTLSSTNTIHFS